MAADEEAASSTSSPQLALLALLAQDVISRGTRLLQEMQLLKDKCKTKTNNGCAVVPGLSSTMSDIKMEKESAQRILENLNCLLDSELEQTRMATIRERLRCSNLPAMERNWNIVKRCHRLAFLEQTLTLPVEKGKPRKTQNPSTESVKSAYVDASVDGGGEWLRIINIEERRLLHQMAEGAWDWDAESDQGDDDASSSEDDDDDDDGISTIRMVKNLVGVARANWSRRFSHPRIHIVLPRLQEGQSRHIDKLLRKMRGLGGHDITIIVDCANSDFCNSPVPAVDTAVSNLTADDLEYLGQTVILDISVLIGLASDTSHTNVEPQPWHKHDNTLQIQAELAGISFLRHNAYPYLRGRKLVCTRVAVEHFHQIVSNIASETEAKRAALVLEPLDDRDRKAQRTRLLDELQRSSIHPVPSDLMLPVQIIDDENATCTAQELVEHGQLPEVALHVDKECLTLPVNRGTFLYGWAAGLTVITTNGAMSRRLLRMVENSLTTNYEGGPRIWMLPFNRALVTKGPRKDNNTTA